MRSFDNIKYVQWLWSKRVKLLVIQVIALVSSTIVSLLIPNQYKSYSIVYPYNLNLFSKETATEQMLQFMNSVDIKDAIIKKFNLIRHYNINPNGKSWYSELLDQYDKNVVINPTEYEAVEIKVFDTDKDTANKMVLAILDETNKKILETQKEKSIEVADMWKTQLDRKKKEVDSLTNLSKQITTQYGLLEYGSQSREASKAYFEQSRGGAKAGSDVTTQMKNIEEKSIDLREIEQHIGNAVAEYDNILSKYDDALKDVNKKLTFSSMVNTPYPADSKSYPIRWLIVLGTCIGAFIISTVVIRITEHLAA
jgi:hypothetical protein